MLILLCIGNLKENIDLLILCFTYGHILVWYISVIYINIIPLLYNLHKYKYLCKFKKI